MHYRSRVFEPYRYRLRLHAFNSNNIFFFFYFFYLRDERSFVRNVTQTGSFTSFARSTINRNVCFYFFFYFLFFFLRVYYYRHRNLFFRFRHLANYQRFLNNTTRMRRSFFAEVGCKRVCVDIPRTTYFPALYFFGAYKLADIVGVIIMVLPCTTSRYIPLARYF